MGGVGIHKPGHDLFIRAQIWPHDICLWSDKWNHFQHVSARNSLQLNRSQAPGIHCDPSLCATIGKISKGTFPTHPYSQCCRFPQSQGRCKTSASLGRTKGKMMLHAIALEDSDASIFAMDRD